MKVTVLSGGLLGTNSYLVSDAERTEAVVVDPVCPYEEVLSLLQPGQRLTAAVLTHGHFDHIEALASYHGAGVPILMHRADEEMLSSPQKNGSLRLFEPLSFPFGADGYLEDGGALPVGKEALCVMHTPGHTKGSICLWSGGAVLSGDTVFAFGDYGRCDLYGGDEAQMKLSLDRFFAKEGEYIIYAGHGDCASYISEKTMRGYL